MLEMRDVGWGGPSGRTFLGALAWVFLLAPAGAGTAQEAARLQEAARRLFLAGEYHAMADSLERLPLDSLSSGALYELGTAQGMLGDQQGAIRSLRTAVEREPEKALYRYQLGRTMAEAGLHSGAEREFEAVLARDTSHTPSLMWLGRIRFENRDYRRAAGLFARLLRVHPRDYLGNYYLGWSYHNLGDLDSAAMYLAVSQSLNPSYAPSAALLGAIRFRQEKYTEALRLYRHASAQQPGNPELQIRLGLCYQKVENALEARLCFERASILDSANAIAWAYLGQALYELKLYDSAAIAFARGVELDEANPGLLLNLGLALAKGGSATAAIDALERAVAAYGPEHIARAHREIGAVYFLQQEFRKAEVAYRRALLYEPADPVARFYLAVSLDQRKQHKAAVEQYGRYLAVSQGDPARQRNEKTARERIKYLKGLP
jgi:tetratricopeptide (TPR) repeat protein